MMVAALALAASMAAAPAPDLGFITETGDEVAEVTSMSGDQYETDVEDWEVGDVLVLIPNGNGGLDGARYLGSVKDDPVAGRGKEIRLRDGSSLFFAFCE